MEIAKERTDNRNITVLCDENGTRWMYSYVTLVASMTNDGKVRRHWNGWTQTTNRHIMRFCGMYKRQFYALPFEDDPYTIVGHRK